MEKRYQQLYSYYYADCLVVCPDCGKDAVVKNENNYKEAALECRHCNLRKTGYDMVLYKAVAKLHCPICAHSIRVERCVKEKLENISVECGECDTKLDLKPRYERYVSNYSKKTNGLKQDDVFGCPLYFQDDCKGNLFWAKNREHLLEMEAYVSSELRTLPYRMRMVERLPAFIKEAKNREAVLKILQKWKNSYK
ncbi:MAG: hypothetical protein L0G39_06120 [Chryseobacterium sp.]|nr:hypothetical protein [Chryseobacterium sp.]MDN5424012.1 hypothetical protein [Chryseobacterium sp.]MDN5476487.1 hypothetical protein [Chryseobacterium sp.]MDN5480131.1 hypothetical protein [Chryseobacterium sp.]